MRVLPVPADASRTTLRVGSTAKARAGSSAGCASPSGATSLGPSSKGSLRVGVTHELLPAHGPERAAPAGRRVGGPRRELAALDPIHRFEEAALAVGEHHLGVLVLADDRLERISSAERDV